MRNCRSPAAPRTCPLTESTRSMMDNPSPYFVPDSSVSGVTISA